MQTLSFSFPGGALNWSNNVDNKIIEEVTGCKR